MRTIQIERLDRWSHVCHTAIVVGCVTGIFMCIAVDNQLAASWALIALLNALSARLGDSEVK